MVTKREIAAAQQALNEAVDHFLNYVDQDRDYYTARSRLRDAYDEWTILRLSLEGEGPAVARATSIAAAKANLMQKRSLRRTILCMVVSNYRGLGVGLTTDQIQSRLQGKHQSVSPRVSELVKTYELLRDSGRKAETSSGAKAIVWQPTQEAIDLVLAAQGDGVGL